MTTDSNVGQMPIASIMADQVARIPAHATVREVAEALRDADVGVLAIFEGDQLVGVTSERDVMHAVADGRDLTTTTAGDLAHTSIVWADSTAPVADVAAEMMEQYVRHVLVEDDGELVGIVSARDVLGVYAAIDTGADEPADPW
jgi:CBS domain-containing protein